MADIQMRRLPVMNREKRLVGILSLADLATKGLLTNNCSIIPVWERWYSSTHRGTRAA
jgi:hypothetical protein